MPTLSVRTLNITLPLDDALGDDEPADVSPARVGGVVVAALWGWAGGRAGEVAPDATRGGAGWRGVVRDQGHENAWILR